MLKPVTVTRRPVHPWDIWNVPSKDPNRKWSGGYSVQFREAVPDYTVLLTERTRLPLEPFESACFARWGDRWAHRVVSSVKAEELQAYFAELAQRGHTSRDIEREKNVLKGFYRWASRSGWSDVDPTDGLERTRTMPDHPTITWTGAEQRRLLDACRGIFPQENVLEPRPRKLLLTSPYLYPLVLVGLRSGLRLGHIINLEWRHVDLTAGRIVIPAREVKNGCEIDVPIDADMRAALKDMLRLAQTAPVMPRRVFDAAGLPLWKDRPDEHAVLHAFRRARKHARIPEGDFNSLRLSFAQNCARARVPMSHPLRVSDWDDPALVKKVYQENGCETAVAGDGPKNDPKDDLSDSPSEPSGLSCHS